jgi:decaprenylphospho-beta-D-erythro-pentofuranosid-2-ulose 2-reductase
MKKILIAGATSAMAEAAARIFAARGERLLLIGRREEALATQAGDLKLRGASLAEYAVADLDDLSQHAGLIDSARNRLGGLDVILIAYGVLPDQKQCDESAELTLSQFHTNAVSQISLALRAAQSMVQAGDKGVVAVISSVAGDRARKSNYAYGSAKAAVSDFLSGLRMRLSDSGVCVLTIKPGVVDTPMTAHLKRGWLMADAGKVGRDIAAAIDRRARVIYTPGFWGPIMLIIRHLPEAVLRRLNF